MFLPPSHALNHISRSRKEHKSFVTGGGHVYPSAEKRLTAMRDRSRRQELQNRRVFQANQRERAPEGERSVCIRKNSISSLRDGFPGYFDVSSSRRSFVP